MICNSQVLLLLALLAGTAHAELQPLADASLSAVSGQGGVYLTGEFSINRDGGPLWSKPATVDAATWTAGQRSCATKGATTPESCGLRLAIRAEQTGGWYVLDNIKGIFSFEGLTLRTRLIESGFAGDGEHFTQDVLEFGLPSEVKFKDTSFTYAVANKGEWRNNADGAVDRDASFQQTNLFSAKIDGSIRMQGNVLVFPTN